MRSYLSSDHLEAPAGGCPSAAALPEIARQPEPTRKAHEQGLSRYVSLIATLLANADSAAAHRRATAIFALMLGTLEIARAIPDTARAEKILEGGVDAALLLAGAQSN